jgi:hypothetical protein
VHCIVFGTPPVSHQPLEQYKGRLCDGDSSVFLSVINEGDFIFKADREYLASKCRWRGRMRLWRCRGLAGCKTPNAESTNTFAKRKLSHSGSVVLLQRVRDGDLCLKICEVDSEPFKRMMPLSWRAHKITTYEKNLAALPITIGLWRLVTEISS